MEDRYRIADPFDSTDVQAVDASRFLGGDCRVVPGLGHGGEGHARDFLRTHLGDWAG